MLLGLVFVVISGIGLMLSYYRYDNAAYGESLLIAVGALVIVIAVAYSIKIADQWNRVVVLHSFSIGSARRWRSK